jgi:hypothetical protein
MRYHAIAKHRHRKRTRAIRAALLVFKRRAGRRRRQLKVSIPRLRAQLRSWLRYVRYRVLLFLIENATLIYACLLVLAATITALWLPKLQISLESFFATEERLQGLRSFFLSVGSALVGAAAIVSSLVLFSMQVNIERMPYGLFRRLSADRRLLGAFTAAFLLAIIIAALSLIPEKRFSAIAVFVSFWATTVVLSLFLYSYRRALVLVNPLRQISMMVSRTRKELRTWERRAARATLVLDRHEASGSKYDTSRAAFFQVNPRWTDDAKQALRYAVSQARRYAKEGDHEISAAATSAIIAINAAYVHTKGRTFFTQHFMFNTTLAADAFLNDTLEHLRQTARTAIIRGDEQQIEQTLNAFCSLVRVYAQIDYGEVQSSKTHAHIAASYLTAEVERVVPHNMPDVLMEGVRAMGRCADYLLAAEGPNGTRTLVEKLGVIACCGLLKEDYRHITLTCVEQLARLDFDVIRSRSTEIGYAAEGIRGSVGLISKLFIGVPDPPLTSTHSTFLAPYYSATDAEALSARLTELANSLAKASPEDAQARLVIEHLEEWADGLYQSQRELFAEAIQKKSQFLFDVMHWISRVTTVLIFVSTLSLCTAHTRDKLRRHAPWLLSTFSFVPDDHETIRFVESFRMTEMLFEAAFDAYRRDCSELAEAIIQILISWMIKGGSFRSGRAILERSIYGVAVLVLLADSQAAINVLKEELKVKVAAGVLSDEERDRAAIEIRGRAKTLNRKGHWSSGIEQAMAAADHKKLRPFLEELADLISPGTIGRAAENFPF